MPSKKARTASQYLATLKRTDSKTEDDLTRFYLRLLKGGSWSYQLRKENILAKKQSQEAYRKKLNKFTKQGFLTKGKKYYIDGKPRIPFEPNPQVIQAFIDRYSILPLESKAAMKTFSELKKQDSWIQTLNEKIDNTAEPMKFVNTLFPLVFMGHEISKFFFRLLLISVSRSSQGVTANTQYEKMHNMLLDVLGKIQLSITHEGADYIGKRIFLDIYVKEVMNLLYATGANEKHWDTMKIAILEDVTIPLLTPISYAHAGKDCMSFNKKEPADRFSEMVGHVKKQPEHYIKEYYGDDWMEDLAAYIHYALSSSLRNPSKEIKEFIGFISSEYNLTKKKLKEVEDEITSKVEQHKNEKATLLF